MYSIASSMEILMADGPRCRPKAEPKRERSPIIAYNGSEDEVAMRGLWNHLNIVCSGVKKRTTNPEVPPRVVYNFLSNDLDKFRIEAHNSVAVLAKSHQSRAYFAPIIAHTLFGFESRQSGTWLMREQKEERLVELFREVMGMEDEPAEEYMDWARRNNIFRGRYYFGELEKIRSHPVILDLLQAIEESDREEWVTEAA
ncbi:MAG: hypothetical protein WD887_00680 [Candidatus Saccharimonadales bacterium]